MNTRKAGWLLVVLMALCAVSVYAWDIVNVSADGLNVKGSTLRIDGTAVTATAAQLNALATKNSNIATGAVLTLQTKAFEINGTNTLVVTNVTITVQR